MRRVVCALVLCALPVWYFVTAARRQFDDPQRTNFDEAVASTDLAADLQRMWETEAMGGGDGEASTLAAILAASRVFNTVALVGKTGAEVKALLGSPVKSSRSVYRGEPFWPLRHRGMVYRFDCGTFGWQFNVYCDGDDARVSEVERLWIH